MFYIYMCVHIYVLNSSSLSEPPQVVSPDDERPDMHLGVLLSSPARLAEEILQ